MMHSQNTPADYSPFSGQKLRGTVNVNEQHWRADVHVWHFNPWTGTKRHSLDVESDPHGLLIRPEGEVSLASSAWPLPKLRAVEAMTEAEWAASGEAFNNAFHKIPTLVSREQWDKIWMLALQWERGRLEARQALARTGLHDDFEAQTFGELPVPLRTSVLTEAEGLVHGARNATYGHPLDDFTRTAGMASAMLAHKLKAPLTAEDVGMFMCLIKLSRQVNAPKRDNMVDLAGYAETVQWCQDERAARGGE